MLLILLRVRAELSGHDRKLKVACGCREGVGTPWGCWEWVWGQPWPTSVAAAMLCHAMWAAGLRPPQ